MKTFSELGVSDTFVKALKENNITTPTEIQVKSIPFLLEKGTDFIGQAQTGTGKTAAFGLPLLQAINPDSTSVQALILSPTRELGQQIAKQLFRFTKYVPKKIFVESVYGGAYIEDQIRALKRPTHIVVATPGRLLDLLERKALNIGSVKTIVLDEADEMLSMGFKKELDAILSQTHGKRNTWLFSATMPPEIKAIIKTYMSPTAHRIDSERLNVINKKIEHQFVVCDPEEKTDILLHFLKTQGANRGIVFCRTKAGAQTLAQQLVEKNIAADAIHGDLMQKERDKVMRAFKNKKLKILIATDIAARGIDVENLSYVVHYQLPEKTEYYTHRSGRTARAGNSGLSLSFIHQTELAGLKGMARDLGFSLKEVHR
ncbi:MAG: DEAD/DEAH box helicase [Bacteroidota bacterium]|nr:DEAD/DEAH box helicase [Bacteroidota bacterium]